jgi:outer membrane protein TolC
VAQARQAAGLAAWNELGRAELAVFQARSDLAAAEGQYHLALLRLADALGLSLATVPGFAGKGGV